MKAGAQDRVVLVTCGKLAEARTIARKAVSERLAACVNIILSPVESFYSWKGNLGMAREYLLVIKTTAKRLAALEKEVKRLHSYETPEFIALPIVAGSRAYLAWLRDNVSRPRR